MNIFFDHKLSTNQVIYVEAMMKSSDSSTVNTSYYIDTISIYDINDNPIELDTLSKGEHDTIKNKCAMLAYGQYWETEDYD